MDNLLEALQSGQAFSRPDKGRKRTPRTQGGIDIIVTPIYEELSPVDLKKSHNGVSLA